MARDLLFHLLEIRAKTLKANLTFFFNEEANFEYLYLKA